MEKPYDLDVSSLLLQNTPAVDVYCKHLKICASSFLNLDSRMFIKFYFMWFMNRNISRLWQLNTAAVPYLHCSILHEVDGSESPISLFRD